MHYTLFLRCACCVLMCIRCTQLARSLLLLAMLFHLAVAVWMYGNPRTIASGPAQLGNKRLEQIYNDYVSGQSLYDKLGLVPILLRGTVLPVAVLFVCVFLFMVVKKFVAAPALSMLVYVRLLANDSSTAHSCCCRCLLPVACCLKPVACCCCLLPVVVGVAIAIAVAANASLCFIPIFVLICFRVIAFWLCVSHRLAVVPYLWDLIVATVACCTTYSAVGCARPRKRRCQSTSAHGLPACSPAESTTWMKHSSQTRTRSLGGTSFPTPGPGTCTASRGSDAGPVTASQEVCPTKRVTLC
jgi:hypothetical protein